MEGHQHRMRENMKPVNCEGALLPFLATLGHIQVIRYDCTSVQLSIKDAPLIYIRHKRLLGGTAVQV